MLRSDGTTERDLELSSQRVHMTKQ
jgi:hypothetical protein